MASDARIVGAVKSSSIVLLALVAAVATPLGTWAKATPPPAATPTATAAPASDTTQAPEAAPATAEPTATAEPHGKHRHHGAAPANGASPSPSPVPTPTSPAFATLDGHWEVVVQKPSIDIYSTFDLHQESDTLSGVWTQSGGKKVPLVGSYDGQHIKLLAEDGDTRITLTGYVENASDIVGIVDGGLPGASPTSTPALAPSIAPSPGASPTYSAVSFTAVHQAVATHHSNLFPKRGDKREKTSQK